MIKSSLALISATISITALAGTIFLNTILGAFGLVTTSVETLSKLTTSQQVVNKMKARHKSKKLTVTKRFTKRTGKRIASSAIAAATIGTVAVIVTVTGLEIVDYCDEKESLNEDENILFGEQDEFNYESCKEVAIEDSKQIVESAVEDSTTAVKEAWQDAKNNSVEFWEELRTSSGDIYDSTTQSTSDSWDEMLEWITN